MSAISGQTSGSSNKGGIAQLYYARQEDVYTTLGLEDFLMREDEDLTIAQSVIDSDFFRIKFLQRTANHDEPHGSSGHGDQYSHVIEARFRGDRPTVRAQRTYAKNHRLVMLWKDMNGIWKLTYGLMHNPTHNTGKEPKDTNSHTIQWTSTTPLPAFTVTIT